MAHINLKTVVHGMIHENVAIHTLSIDRSGRVEMELVSLQGKGTMGNPIGSDFIKLILTFDKEESQNYFKTGSAPICDGWISVKEKVPEYGKRVLLYMKAPDWGDKQIHIGSRTHTDMSGDHWNVDYGHYISHWMSLPELPCEYVDMQVTPLTVPYPSVKGPDGEGPGSEE
jgi:hypothetical protein